MAVMSDLWIREMAQKTGMIEPFVEAQKREGVISYGLFLDENRMQMTVVALHPDSESLQFHLETGATEFQKFADLIDLSRIEVYGVVSDGVLERLNRKARMLGSGTVAVHELHAGFAR